MSSTDMIEYIEEVLEVFDCTSIRSKCIHSINIDSLVYMFFLFGQTEDKCSGSLYAKQIIVFE